MDWKTQQGSIRINSNRSVSIYGALKWYLSLIDKQSYSKDCFICKLLGRSSISINVLYTK